MKVLLKFKWPLVWRWKLAGLEEAYSILAARGEETYKHLKSVRAANKILSDEVTRLQKQVAKLTQPRDSKGRFLPK